MIGSALAWVNAVEVYTLKVGQNAIVDTRIFALRFRPVVFSLSRLGFFNDPPVAFVKTK
jgi:hypothetical protein